MTQIEDFDEVSSQLARGKTSDVLNDVRIMRAAADDREGSFRDYPDTDASCAALFSPVRLAEAESIARSVKKPWIAQLFSRVGLVWLLLQPGGWSSTNTREVRRVRLKNGLLSVAELCVSWSEALDIRDIDEKATRAMMAPPSLWFRVKRWFRQKLNPVPKKPTQPITEIHGDDDAED